jgi:D-methionine transport system permease protein
MFNQVDWDKMLQAMYQTLYMSVITIIFVFVLGLTMGLLLYLTKKDSILESKIINKILSIYINISRSLPFIIVLILLIPITAIIVGTIYGEKAALPALIIGVTPFYARLVEMSLEEVDKGVIEAATSLGATQWQIIYKVLIKESLPSLIRGLTVTMVTLVGYTTLAGAIGAGGLGYIAYLYGFQRGNYQVMILATLLILLIVFIVQYLGELIVRSIDKR